MKLLLHLLITFSLSFNSFALNKTESNQSLQEIIKKYDYLLSSHPNAHIESFRKKAIRDFDEDFSRLVQGRSLQELRNQALIIVAKVPKDDKRAELSMMINHGSKSDLISLLKNKAFIRDAFQGEGANFTSSQVSFSSVVGALLVVSLIYVIIDEISEAINYEVFSSYSTYASFNSFTGTCEYSYVSSYEKELMKEDARQSCLALAKYPETCRFHEYGKFKTYEYTEYHFGEDRSIYSCSVNAQFKSDREK